MQLICVKLLLFPEKSWRTLMNWWIHGSCQNLNVA
jgi:hypothetical protein